MRVYLVRTSDFLFEDFDNVLNLLNAYPGAIEFIDGGILDLNVPNSIKIFNNKTKFENQEQAHYLYSVSVNEGLKKYEKPTFPFKKKYYTWNELFIEIEQFKFEKKFDSNDFVFLLTNQYNEKNWFAFIAPSMRTGFIHTDDWPWFFGDGTDIRYPISYEVTAWILRGLMYRSQKEVVSGFHKKSTGCFNDFCKNKKEITIKMRTADVCDDCLEIIKNKDIQPHFLNQLFSIMDGIRANLLFRKRVEFIQKDSRIKIDLETKKIFLIDFGNLDVRLNPKEMSLYLLFINHENGISLNSICEYEIELFNYYQQISGRFNIQDMKNTISLLVNYLDGELHTTISRIKSKFIKAIGNEVAKNYYIKPLPTLVHGITVCREGVCTTK
jgi:hypothetical protein